jgi:hypothetical protein
MIIVLSPPLQNKNFTIILPIKTEQQSEGVVLLTVFTGHVNKKLREYSTYFETILNFV